MNNKILVFIVIASLAVFSFFYLSRSSNPSAQDQKQVPTTQVGTNTDTGSSVIPEVPVTQVNVNTNNAPSISPKVPILKTYNISVVNFTFDPSPLTINKGDTIVWTNNDFAPHQIIGDSLNGPVMSKGQSYSFTFNSSGTFNYHCAIHPGMKGLVTVK